MGLTLSESERRRLDGTLPERAVVVTFDDGFASILHAKPILDALGYPATTFVVSNFVDSGEPLRWPGIEIWSDSDAGHELKSLTWPDLESLVDDGWEVGSHTVTHPLLPAVSDDLLAQELENSRSAIAARLGRCDTIAYPYGITDERVAAAAEQAGYLAACTLTFAHDADERYRRPRTGLSGADRGIRLLAQLSTPGQRLRRTWLARALRRRRFHRDWLPPHG